MYSDEAIRQLEQQYPKVVEDLQNLQVKLTIEGQRYDSTSRLREHLLHGAGRRIGLIRRSIENIYNLFPPSTQRLLSRDSLADVQINLHAFLMHLYGLNDNWAWAFVLRHDLEATIGDRRRIGLYINATRKHLPPALKEYLTTTLTTDWHEKYAKSYRDALAHRIPPYVPPSEMTSEEGRRYNELETEKLESLRRRNLERFDEISGEQAALGRPGFSFLHAFNEDTPPRPILLHPQLLSDGLAVAEFGELFLQHWHEQSPTGNSDGACQSGD